jgi:hypothetical protein
MVSRAFIEISAAMAWVPPADIALRGTNPPGPKKSVLDLLLSNTFIPLGATSDAGRTSPHTAKLLYSHICESHAVHVFP